MGPKRLFNFALVLCVIAFSVTAFSACSDYWWTRGQPPSVPELLAKSSGTLERAIAENSSTRPVVAELSEKIAASLTSAAESAERGDSPEVLLKSLDQTSESFLKLEGAVSVGSRAAQAELAGQLRSLRQTARQGGVPEYGAVGLLASRTFRFLANELSVPAPQRY